MMEKRIELLESAVEYLKRGQEITNEQLAELIRLGERQIAQKEALERAFGLVGRVTERTEALERRVQTIENAAEHERRADIRAGLEGRVKAIEAEAPVNRLVRSAVLAAAGAIIVAAVALVWEVVTTARIRTDAGPQVTEARGLESFQASE